MRIVTLYISVLSLMMSKLWGQSIEWSDQTFQSPQIVEDVDSLIVTNCVFQNISGVALRITNVQYVSLNGNMFRNINTGNGSEAAVAGRAIGYLESQENSFNDITGNAYRIPYRGDLSLADRSGMIIIQDDRFAHVTSTETNQGNGIYVFHTDSIFIHGNHFQDIDHNAVAVGSPNNKLQEGILFCVVENNTVDSVMGNGILGTETIAGALISNNTIRHIATDGVGSLPMRGDHGIYWQAPGAIITGNRIDNNRDGSVGCNEGCRGIGISIRTNALIAANEVSNCEGGGIVYWGDHPAQGTLTIANNIVYDNTRNGILINGSYNGETYPDTVMVYHNTVLNVNPEVQPFHFYCPLSMYDYFGGLIDPQNFRPYAEAVGNLLIFEGMSDTAKFIYESEATFVKKAYNFLANDDPAMVDYSNRDLRLLAGAEAIDYLPMEEQNVTQDFFGRTRMPPLDAGAHEYDIVSSGPTFFPDPSLGFRLFPNPFHGILHLESNEEMSRIELYRMTGEMVYAMDPVRSKQVRIEADLVQGYYILSVQLKSGKIITRWVVKS